MRYGRSPGDQSLHSARADMNILDNNIRFDKITHMASRLLNAPTSLLTIIDDEGGRQVFKSAVGVPVEVSQSHSTPLRYSFCKYVRDWNEVLRIDDAREHSVLKHNPAIEEFGIISYLGIPFHGERGKTLGALCCIDYCKREWLADDVDILTNLASIADDQYLLSSVIEDRVKAKRIAEKAVTARASFLSHANHEIRTPLSAITGAARLLSRMNLEEKTKKLIGLVEYNSGRLRELANDLVRIAELDCATVTIMEETFNLVEVIQECADSYRSFAALKGLNLIVDICIEEDATFLFDKKILVNVVEGLVDNALQSTAKGEVRISIEASPFDDGVVVSICDTGSGLEPGQEEVIFKEFEAHNPRTARVGGGTGLGMSIIRREVELLGGSISVSSWPGAGTVFKIFLPILCEAKTDVHNQHDRSEDYHRITCLECGAKFSLLRRHLSEEHGMTPRAYRSKWGLPEDWPLSSEAYRNMRKGFIDQT